MRSIWYYAAVIPVWMVINVLLVRATNASRRGIPAAWGRAVSELRGIREQRRQDRALRHWIAGGCTI